MSNQNKAQVFVQSFWDWIASYDGAKTEIDNGIVKVEFDDGSIADFTEPINKEPDPRPRFHVPVRYIGVKNFFIHAKDARSAEEAADQCFKNDTGLVELGNEYQNVEAIFEARLVPELDKKGNPVE